VGQTVEQTPPTQLVYSTGQLHMMGVQSASIEHAIPPSGIVGPLLQAEISNPSNQKRRIGEKKHVRITVAISVAPASSPESGNHGDRLRMRLVCAP
jgi:hypothetical protein